MLASRSAWLSRPRDLRVFASAAAQGTARSSMQLLVKGVAHSNTAVLQHHSVRKPLCDTRIYQHAQLPNGVRVLVVQDKDAIYAAACVNVQMGYFDDPPNLPGAAHFLEHMVHLGSKAFPDEREYKAFLAQHGGSSNASTSMVHTRYHFKVHSDALQGALARIGAMLSCPLIAQESSAREVENVHAEYSRNTNSDQRKLLQLRRSLCQAPYRNFSTGSLTTLWEQPQQEGLDVPELLRDLWWSFYRADATCVAVVGPQEPEVLLQWVADAFADMPANNSPTENGSSCKTAAAAAAAGTAAHQTSDLQQQQQQQQEGEQQHVLYILQHQQHAAFDAAPTAAAAIGVRLQHRYPIDVVSPRSRGLLVRVAPQRDLRELELSWYLPVGVMMHSSTKPWQWASHLLGHEGPGSVAHLLKSQGLVQSLDVGMGEEVRLGRGWMFWRVAIALTQAGEDHLEHVVASVYRAIQVLDCCTDEQLEHTWQEAAALAQLRFDWRDPTDPLACAQSAAYALHYYPPEETLSGPALMTHFDASLLRWFVGQLTPHNMNVYYSSRRNAQAASSKEQWYGAQYAMQKLPGSWLEAIARYMAVDTGCTGVATAAAAGHLPAAAVDAAATQQWQGWQQYTPVAGQLHLPAPNWAIPIDLELRAEAADSTAPAAAGTHGSTGAAPAAAAAAAAGVYDGVQATPELLLEQPGLCAWHHKDISYGLPKVHLRLHLATPAVYATPEATVAARLLLRVVEDLLLPQTYPADLAGTSYSLSSEQGGLTLKIVGFSGVAQQLLLMVLRGLLEATPEQVQERFPTMLGRLQQALTNWANNNPAQHAEYGAHHLLQLQHHHNAALLKAAAAAAPDHLLALQRQLATGNHLHVDMLAYGNISKQEAGEVVSQVQQLLQPKGLPAGCWPPAKRVLCLSPVGTVRSAAAAAAADSEAANGEASDMYRLSPPACEACPISAAGSGLHMERGGAAVHVTYMPTNPNPSNSNSAIYYVVQLGPDNFNTAVLLDLFVQMSSKAAFHALRTKQRLGYSVSLSSSSLHRQLGLVIRVQSPNRQPDVLASAVRGWLCDFRAELADILGQQLQQHKKALGAKYLEPPKSLQEAARRTWSPIQTRTLAFDRRRLKAAAVEAQSAEQLLQFFDHYLHPDAAQHKALCVQIWGGSKAAAMAAAAVVDPTPASDAAGALQAAVACAGSRKQQQSIILTVLADQVEQFKSCQPLMPVAELQLPPHITAL